MAALRPPPPGETCDCHIGVDHSGHDPKLRRCPNPATVSRRQKLLPFEVWLCADCERSLEERGKLR